MWLLLAVAVLYHEIACEDGELLSEEVDRQLVKHPILTVVFGAVTVAHLYNLLPNKIDPYHQLANAASRVSKGA